MGSGHFSRWAFVVYDLPEEPRPHLPNFIGQVCRETGGYSREYTLQAAIIVYTTNPVRLMAFIFFLL